MRLGKSTQRLRQVTCCLLTFVLLSSPLVCGQSRTEPASKIAFARQSERDGGIYTVNPDGSGLTRLTHDPSDLLPVWSPDGSRIAFRRDDGLLGAGVWVMNVDGSNPVRVGTYRGHHAFAHLKVRWSPDGSKLAFASSTGISVVNADGSDLQFVAVRDPLEETSPRPVNEGLAWAYWVRSLADLSRDGSRIVFEPSLSGSLYVMDIAAWARRPHALEIAEIVHHTDSPDRPSVSASSPSWSPDGSKIAFISLDRICNGLPDCVDGVDQVSGLYVMNADGSNLLRVADQVVREPMSRNWHPSWSPDGSRIVFARWDFPWRAIRAGVEWSDVTSDIYTVNADGSGLFRLTHDPAAEDVFPAWSPWLQ